jgi:outer membrane protein OmpA-like peptidoglycan-associated protein
MFVSFMAVSVALAIGAGCRDNRTENQWSSDPAQKTAEDVALPRVPPTQPPTRAPAADDPGATEATRPTGDVTAAAVVIVDTRLAALCALPHSHVFFEFDVAKLQPEAKQHLDRITTCVREGAAKGRELRVIGHTDPQGDEAYNQQLGTRRAESVASYLQQQGVKNARIETASRGQELANADEPAGWPRDRRVTIRLAD